MKWLYITLGILVSLIIIFLLRNKIKNVVWDLISEKRIQSLHPRVRDYARKFLEEAEKKGIKLRIVSGLRSYEEQDKLYAQGRTEPGNVVTNAKGGYSSHNFGTAIDVVEIKDGKALWANDWNKIAEIGKAIGFAWGGDWNSFTDKPHFEMNFGKTLAELRSLHDSANGDYVNLA